MLWAEIDTPFDEHRESIDDDDVTDVSIDNPGQSNRINLN